MPESQHLFTGIGGRDLDGSGFGPDMEQQTVENFIPDRHIDHDKRIVRSIGESIVGVFPVEGMSQVQLAAPPLGEIVFEQFGIVDRKMSLQETFVRRKQFQCFQEMIDEIAVKILGDLFPFRFRFIGKSKEQVSGMA